MLAFQELAQCFGIDGDENVLEKFFTEKLPSMPTHVQEISLAYLLAREVKMVPEELNVWHSLIRHHSQCNDCQQDNNETLPCEISSSLAKQLETLNQGESHASS